MDALAQHALRAGSEFRLDALRRRFCAFRDARHWRFDSWRRRLRYWLIPALLGASVGFGGLQVYDLSEKFGSAELALRHLAAAPDCNAARAQGLAPARRGEPGYYARHDRDNDGIACEPYRGH